MSGFDYEIVARAKKEKLSLTETHCQMPASPTRRLSYGQQH